MSALNTFFAGMDPAQCEQIQLARAVLCQDCETISNTPHPYCPACGSQSLLQLARVLNRETAPRDGELSLVREGAGNG